MSKFHDHEVECLRCEGHLDRGAAARLRQGNQLLYVEKGRDRLHGEKRKRGSHPARAADAKDAADRQAASQEATVWVQPAAEAEIAFRDITSDGVVRNASFKWLKS